MKLVLLSTKTEKFKEDHKILPKEFILHPAKLINKNLGMNCFLYKILSPKIYISFFLSKSFYSQDETNHFQKEKDSTIQCRHSMPQRNRKKSKLISILILIPAALIPELQDEYISALQLKTEHNY